MPALWILLPVNLAFTLKRIFTTFDKMMQNLFFGEISLLSTISIRKQHMYKTKTEYRKGAFDRLSSQEIEASTFK